LYWRDRNLRFHRYEQLPPSPHIDDLLQEIDRDPTAIFWGKDGKDEAFRQFRYPTVPLLGVSDEFRNRLLVKALREKHAGAWEDQP
jgi:hypothetical protein